MGVLKYINRIISKAVSESLLSNELRNTIYGYNGNGAPIYPNDTMTTYIEKGMAYNADLFSIVNYITTTAAQLPFCLYNEKGDKVEEHELLDLLKKPNEFTGSKNFIEAAIGFKLLTGNSYIWGNKILSGKIKELYVLPSHQVEIISGDSLNPVRSYKIMGTTYEFKKEEVCHIKTWNPDTLYLTGSNLYGMSPLKAALRLLTMSNDIYTANSRALQNGGAIGIVSSNENANGFGMSPEQASQAQESFEKKYAGSDKYGKVAFTSANIKYDKIGLSPQELMILESANFSFKAMCNVYKFPSVLLNNDSQSTYNNVIEAKKQLYIDVLIPELQYVLDSLNQWLVKENYKEKLTFKIDYSDIDILQKDMQTLATSLNAAWWIKGTDKQKAMGIQEDPALNQYFIPMGYQSLSDMNDGDVDELLKRLNITDYK